MSSSQVTPRPQAVLALVLVDVAGRGYGLPIAQVQDIVKVCRANQDAAWRVQQVVAGLASADGTLTIGGRSLPVVDLGECLGLAKARAARRTRSVVVIQAAEQMLGLLVDPAVDIVEVPWTSIDSVVPTSVQHPAIQQVVWLGDRVIGLLDAERLLVSSARRVATHPG